MKIWRGFWNLFDWIDYNFRMFILSILDFLAPAKEEKLTPEQEKIVAFTRTFHEIEGRLPTFPEIAEGLNITIKKFWISFADLNDLFEKTGLKK